MSNCHNDWLPDQNSEPEPECLCRILFQQRRQQASFSVVFITQCVKGGGVRKMFFSETTKGLFWSIGSSYWMFNLEVHI